MLRTPAVLLQTDGWLLRLAPACYQAHGLQSVNILPASTDTAPKAGSVPPEPLVRSLMKCVIESHQHINVEEKSHCDILRCNRIA
jgi:hypothetical protein